MHPATKNTKFGHRERGYKTTLKQRYVSTYNSLLCKCAGIQKQNITHIEKN